MNKLCVLSFIISIIFACTIAQSNNEPPKQGQGVDEVVVDTYLNVRKKPATPSRRQRHVVPEYLIRVKRQRFGRPQPALARPGTGSFGSSASQANANSQSVGFGPNGFGGAAANAQAQGFQSQGPLGGFGASAANTQTQSFQAGPNGIQGAAGLSGSQVYKLPNGQSINVAYTNGFSVGPNGRPAVSNANSVTFNRP